MRKLTQFLPLALVIALAALWVINCSGPRPSASHLRVQPPQSAGEPYLLSAVISNGGIGHGEVEVTFSLRDRATGSIYAQSETVTLEENEQAVVTVAINAPPGSYTPQVQVDYPPR